VKYVEILRFFGKKRRNFLEIPDANMLLKKITRKKSSLEGAVKGFAIGATNSRILLRLMH
jgi:hypothetical protein